MPFYTYKCLACEAEFERMLPLSEYASPQFCECGGESKKTITGVNFVLKGDGWPGRANKINGQMLKRREAVGKKEDEIRRDGPKMTLMPNVNGEQVDSWREAQKLAAEKGKDTSTYEPMVRKEKAEG